MILPPLAIWILVAALSAACGVALLYFWRWRNCVQSLQGYSQQVSALEELNLGEGFKVWDCSPDGLILIDEHGLIVHSNWQMQSLFGYGKNELVGQPFGMLFPGNRPLDLDSLRPDSEQRQQMILALDGIGDGLWARRKNGSEFSAEISIARGNGNCSPFYGVSIRDISERMQVALGILDSTVDAIFAYDIDSMRIIYANPGAEKQLGYSREELLDLDPLCLLDEEQRAQFREQFMRVATGEATRNSRHFVYLPRDRDCIPVEVSMHIVDHADHSYIISLGRDVSDRVEAMRAVEIKSIELQELNDELTRERENLEAEVKERTRQLESAREHAEQANLAKSSFLASMSHEIRTPMNGVVSMIELLRESRLDEDQRAKVDTIQDSAQSLLTIIDEILDFSKVEAGRIELSRDEVNFPELTNSVYNSLLAIARNKNVILGFYHDPAITRLIVSDNTRLRQIITNLVGNAIKFSSGLGRQGRVEMRFESLPDSRVQILVEDNGVGISAHALESIFEPFEQEDGSTLQRFGGTGLGLPITKALVEKMDGSIRVSSQQDKYTRFTVDLPIEPALDQPEIADPEPLRNSLCVLLCNEDRRRRDWRDWLVQQGADVVCIGDWENLLTTLKLQSDGNYKLVGIVIGEPVQAEARAQIDLELQQRNLDRFILLQDHEPVAGEAGPWRTLAQSPNESINFSKVLSILCGADEQPAVSPPAAMSQEPEQVEDEADREAAGQIKVLVAEDNPINQSVIGSQLEALGFASTLVGDGVEALKTWKLRQHSLLLTDLHMPNMDGYTLAREIRRREHDSERTPIIAYTANAVKGERDRCLDCGMDDYLTKPIALKDLEEKISSWARQAKIADTGTGESCLYGDELDQNLAAHPVLDVNVLKGLVGDKEELILRLLRTYEESLAEHYGNLVTAYDADNWEDMQMISHTLKSSSRSIGALPLGELCSAIEEASRDCNVAAVAAAMARLQETVEQVQEALLPWLHSGMESEGVEHARVEH